MMDWYLSLDHQYVNVSAGVDLYLVMIYWMIMELEDDMLDICELEDDMELDDDMLMLDNDMLMMDDAG